MQAGRQKNKIGYSQQIRIETANEPILETCLGLELHDNTQGST